MAEREQVLEKFVNKVANEQQYRNCEVDIKKVSSDGANYASELYEIKISAPKISDLHLFAKISTMSEYLRKQTKVEGINNELFYFTELAKEFGRLEDKHNIAEHHKLRTPKFYGCDPTYLNEIFLFENLGVKGYQSFDRFKITDWNYASAAIKELAKFHALSVAYFQENPELYMNYSKTNKTASLMADVYNTMLEKSIPQALEVTREENKDKMNKHFSNNKFSEYMKRFLSILRRPVLIHADYRPNNLMHKVKDDSTYEIVILDFQTLAIGCPIVDLLYFIFSCTDEKFRKQHFDELGEFYYKQFSLASKRLNIDVNVVYPKDDFDYELKEMMLYGLYVSIMILPVITVDPKDAPVMKDLSDVIIKGNSMYIERLNGVINDYVKWGLL